MMKILQSLLVSLALWLDAAVGQTPITISHQGPVYWALPLYVADFEGYFAAQDLDVTFAVYPSGAPQVADAVDNAAWDIGAAGVVPNIIGGSQGIETIGISNDESATNALVATVAGLAAWPPASIADTPIALTANSTGQYAVEACLVSEGFDLMDTNFVFEEQSGVLDALADGSVEYGGLWAPNLYLFLESSPGSHIVCSGLTGGAIIPGGIMIRNEFIQTEFGQTTALKALAAWMRGIEFIKNPDNRAQLLSYMETYYASYNVSISMSAMEQEIDLRPLYGLDEQLELMKRQNGAPSTVDGWYDKVSSFLLNNGVLTEIPEGSSYISDSYMAAIDADPELRAFATFGETSTSSAARVNESSLSKVTMYGVSVVGCVALAVL